MHAQLDLTGTPLDDLIFSVGPPNPNEQNYELLLSKSRRDDRDVDVSITIKLSAEQHSLLVALLCAPAPEEGVAAS